MLPLINPSYTTDGSNKRRAAHVIQVLYPDVTTIQWHDFLKLDNDEINSHAGPMADEEDNSELNGN